MKTTGQVNVRLDAALMKRLEAERARCQKLVPGTTVTLTEIVRTLVLRGLESKP